MAFYTVPRRDDMGDRLTYSVKAYTRHVLPGWKTVRTLGGFYQIPPGILSYWKPPEIEQFVRHASKQQRDSFEYVCCCPTWHFKTKDVSKNAIYSTGGRYYYKGAEEENLVVTPMRGRCRGKPCTFLKVNVDYNGEPQEYYLMVYGEVSMRTFYKYLLFYHDQVSIISTKLCRAANYQKRYNEMRSPVCFTESCIQSPEP